MTRAPFEIFGFNEAVLIVRDERPHLDCWLGQGAWELRHEGAVDRRLLQAWGRPGEGARFRLTLPRRSGESITLAPLPLDPDEVSA